MSDRGQTLLETMSILEMLLTKLDANSRAQVHSSVLDDIHNGVNSVVTKLGATDSPIWIPDFVESIKEYKDSNVTYLTNDMKTTIVSALTELETTVACYTYQYYCDHDFSPREKTIPLLRRCVQLYYFS